MCWKREKVAPEREREREMKTVEEEDKNKLWGEEGERMWKEEESLEEEQTRRGQSWGWRDRKRQNKGGGMREKMQIKG